jgi:hypothetical protein
MSKWQPTMASCYNNLPTLVDEYTKLKNMSMSTPTSTEVELLCRVPRSVEECERIPGCERIGLDNYVTATQAFLETGPFVLITQLCNTQTLPSKEVCIKYDEELAPLRAAFTETHPLRQNLHKLYMDKCGRPNDLEAYLTAQSVDFNTLK